MSILTSLISRAAAPPREGGFGGAGGGGGFTGADGGGDEWAKISTAYACVSLIAQTVAGLPKRIVPRGTRTRSDNRDPQYRHIWGRPNPDTSNVVFWEAALTSCLVRGNTHIWKDRINDSDPASPVINLWNLHPRRVRVGIDSDRRKVFALDRDTPATSANIMHVPALSTDGVRGISPVEEAAARSLQLASLGERFAGNSMLNNATPSGVLSTEQGLTQLEADEIKKRWLESYGGAARAGSVAVMGKGAKFDPVTFTNEALQFLGLREFQRDDIVQWWRVPPHLIGLIDKPSTWGSGIEQLGIGFVTYTLLPWIIRFEQAINDELLPDDLEVKFVVNGLLRGDMATRFASYAQGRQWGWLSAEDILELEDLPPRGIPDDYLVPVNFTQIARSAGATVSPTDAGRERLAGRLELLLSPSRGVVAEAPAGDDDDDDDDEPTSYRPSAPDDDDEFVPAGGDSTTAQMAEAFLRDRSYSQIGIDFHIEGPNPKALVQQRLRRYWGESPAAVRDRYIERRGVFV